MSRQPHLEGRQKTGSDRQKIREATEIAEKRADAMAEAIAGLETRWVASQQSKTG